MKIIVRVLLVAVLGFGIYKGYYLVQRELINMRLEAVESTCNPVPRENTPEMIELKKQLCILAEQQNLQLRKAARASKTDKEFSEKVQALTGQWAKEDKESKLFAQYKARKQQRENE